MTRTPLKIGMVCLTVIILYLPYCWLMFYTGWDWQFIRLWPLFPGLAISTATRLINSSKLAADSRPGRGTRVYGIVVGFFDPWSIAVSRKVLVDLRRIVRFVIRAHFGHLCFAESMTRS